MCGANEVKKGEVLLELDDIHMYFGKVGALAGVSLEVRKGGERDGVHVLPQVGPVAEYPPMHSAVTLMVSGSPSEKSQVKMQCAKVTT